MFGLVFTKVQGESEDYVRRKLQAAAADPEDVTPEEVTVVAATITDDPLPVSDLEGLDPSPEQLAEVEARRRCALRNLLTDSPLLEDEEVQDDLFTFLTEPYEELPVGTAVLRRTTNRAVLYYIFPDFQVTPHLDLEYVDVPAALVEKVEPLSGPVEGPRPQETLATGISIDFKEIAKSVAGGLVSGVLGKIGALIFDQIFPPSLPSYFDEVYKQITKIVKKELRQHDIDLIGAKINAVLDWERRIYAPKNPRKVTDRHEREKLFDQVEGKINELDQAMSILTDPKWKEPGLSVFTIAGGVYLGLCQEACLIDYKVDDPAKSSYARTVELTAADYAASAETTYNEILKKRIEAVYLKREVKNLKIGRKNYMTDAYRWVDPIAGTQGGLHALRKKGKKEIVGEPKKEGEADMQQYREKLPGMLSKELGNPLGVAAEWRKLTTKPLPQS